MCSADNNIALSALIDDCLHFLTVPRDQRQLDSLRRQQQCVISSKTKNKVIYRCSRHLMGARSCLYRMEFRVSNGRLYEGGQHNHRPKPMRAQDELDPAEWELVGPASNETDLAQLAQVQGLTRVQRRTGLVMRCNRRTSRGTKCKYSLFWQKAGEQLFRRGRHDHKRPSQRQQRRQRRRAAGAKEKVTDQQKDEWRTGKKTKGAAHSRSSSASVKLHPTEEPSEHCDPEAQSLADAIGGQSVDKREVGPMLSLVESIPLPDAEVKCPSLLLLDEPILLDPPVNSAWTLAMAAGTGHCVNVPGGHSPLPPFSAGKKAAAATLVPNGEAPLPPSSPPSNVPGGKGTLPPPSSTGSPSPSPSHSSSPSAFWLRPLSAQLAQIAARFQLREPLWEDGWSSGQPLVMLVDRAGERALAIREDTNSLLVDQLRMNGAQEREGQRTQEQSNVWAKGPREQILLKVFLKCHFFFGGGQQSAEASK